MNKERKLLTLTVVVYSIFLKRQNLAKVSPWVTNSCSSPTRITPSSSLFLSAGLHGGNQPVQREQEPPEAAGRAAAASQRRGQADAGPGLAAGAQPALAQPLPPY